MCCMCVLMDIPYFINSQLYNNYNKKKTLPKSIYSRSLHLFSVSACPRLKIKYNYYKYYKLF